MLSAEARERWVRSVLAKLEVNSQLEAVALLRRAAGDQPRRNSA